MQYVFVRSETFRQNTTILMARVSFCWENKKRGIFTQWAGLSVLGGFLMSCEHGDSENTKKSNSDDQGFSETTYSAHGKLSKITPMNLD